MGRHLLMHLASLFLFITTSFGNDWLTVRDPRGWRWGQGTIEKAEVTARPSGIYMEYELYLTFSAKNLGFSNSDSLEVELQFTLPEDAIVHDSWLWIGDTIVRGTIMDKWTAELIYEQIVKRRRDPSILYKLGGGQYDLRIFPMSGNELRKAKISYLVPTQWNAERVYAPLPTNLLRTSAYPSTIHLVTWPDEQWKHPTVLEFPNIVFQGLDDTMFGTHLQADIPAAAIQDNVHFAVDAPLNNGIYVSKFHNGTEGFYQLALLPSRALNLPVPLKVAILIDYDASKSTGISKGGILQNLQSLLHTSLTHRDSFNLIFSQLNIARLSEVWLHADSITIDSAFSHLGTDPFANYSNLPSLLSNGIDFVKNNGNDGSILLVANSDQVGDYQTANGLLHDVIGLMDPKLPIHVADFQNTNWSYHYIGGKYYYGNEYFYMNLTRLTTANYAKITTSFSEMLAQSFRSLGGFMTSADIYTKLQNGFCYGRYTVGGTSQTVYLSRPILQVGKYHGTFPFVLEVSGVFQSQVFSQQYTVNDTDIHAADTLCEEMWTGNYIRALESQPQTNEIVGEIVYQSISNRVLSIYSAFLCLEPGGDSSVCYDCRDNEIIVDVDEDNGSAVSDSLFQAYPNPFNSQTTIKIKLPNAAMSERASFRIYNVLGQGIRTFVPATASGRIDAEFVWDGKNDNGTQVSSGMYLFVVATPEKLYTLKLLLAM